MIGFLTSVYDEINRLEFVGVKDDSEVTGENANEKVWYPGVRTRLLKMRLVHCLKL